MTMFTRAPSAMNTEGGKNKKPEEWTNRFNLLLKSMQDALILLYDGLETDEDGSLTDVDKESLGLALDVEATVPQISEIFTHNCQKITKMISEPTKGPVRLPLISLLTTISRCLRVSYTDVKSVPSMSELAGCLPAVHRAALEILTQLILSCKTSLLPQSQTVTNLCFQVLASAKHMEKSERSTTVACAYQALGLIVQIFGWGRYLTQHSESLIEGLIEVIKWQKKALINVTGQSKDSFRQDTLQGIKKRGKKKKNKAESYSDLAKTNAVTGEISMPDVDVASNIEATVGALELSKLILGNVSFTSVQRLMRCVLDTAKKIYCEQSLVCSPYTRAWCRRVLYSAVFACATVKLDRACSRNDAVTHFQLTSLALSLLNDGLNKDYCQEVRTVCKESLNILLVIGSLNRPIVNRIQPSEDSSTKDVTELEIEIENIRDENESLQKRLIDSEMENQTQTRLIASMRQEMEELKKAKNEKPAPCENQKVYISDPTDNRLLSDNCSEVSFENEFESDDDEEEEQEGVERTKDSTVSGNVQDQTGIVLEASSVISATEAERHQGSSHDDSQVDLSKSAKRKCSVEDYSETSRKIKMSKVDFSETVNNTDADSVQDMISDFVDADPDSV